MPRNTLLHRIAAAATGIALVASLAACSAQATDTPTTSADTRVVATAHGDITVPAAPQRVVSLQSWTTESLIDLGVTPVGVEDPGEQYVPARYLDTWKAADKVTSGAEIDFEKIAALKPDLIVGVAVPYLDKAYEKLSAIAPTAFVKWDDTKPWTSYPDATADFVNRPDQLAQLEKKYEERLDEVKSKYATELSTLKWDIIQGGFDAGNYWIYAPAASPAGQVLTALGAQFASASASVDLAAKTRSVSYEQADLLSDADVIVCYQNNDGSPANNIDQLFALPAWKSLPAVTSGGLVGTSDFLAGSYSDFLGLLQTIEDHLASVAGR